MGYKEKWLRELDLEANGLRDEVDKNIERNRMGSAVLEIQNRDGSPVQGAEVEICQKSHDFKFGCNAFLAGGFDEEKKNQAYEEMFGVLFNQTVIPFYWRDDEPERGKTRFYREAPYIYRRNNPEYMLDFCERTRTQPKAHNMVWQNPIIGLPDWFPEDKEEAQKVIDERIHLLSEKYADRIPVWDVTNEVTAAPGFEKMPPDFDTKAYLLADKLFPKAHLILNDYNCFYHHFEEEDSALYRQVERILKAGGRIDGIGMQYHLFMKKEELEKFADTNLNARYNLYMLSIYERLNRDIHVSEITVPSYESTPELLEAQAAVVENLYRLWFSVKNVKSIVWWNFIDGYAYARPDWDENYYGGGLLMKDFTAKPAYHVLDRLIHKEWHSEKKAVTDQWGRITFDGFFGDYEIKIKKGGDEEVRQYRHLKDSQTAKIVL